jgi:hypothetical protein
MTFKEFFEKKKIDLKQFALEEKELFVQMKKEYDLMGPKSFDHSKKFHFNKLRLKYPVKEVKEKEDKVEIVTSSIPAKRPKPIFKSPKKD